MRYTQYLDNYLVKLIWKTKTEKLRRANVFRIAGRKVYTQAKENTMKATVCWKYDARSKAKKDVETIQAEQNILNTVRTVAARCVDFDVK